MQFSQVVSLRQALAQSPFCMLKDPLQRSGNGSGREETVGVMVENAKKNRRYTGLKLRLQGKTG